jgi:arsenate reductase
MSDAQYPITIFHNPACGTSRNALAMIQAAGYEPEVIEYLKTGWSRPQLVQLLSRAGLTAREALREKGTPAAELGLLAPEVADAAIIEAMIQHPILVNRPLVASPKGVRLCRPSEVVLELLDRQPAAFTKEDGEVVKLG